MIGHLLAFGFLFRRDVGGFAAQVQVGHKPVQVFGGDGFIEETTIAGGFTGMMADPSANGRQRIVFFDEVECFLVAAPGDEGHVALHADPCGTGVFAGRDAAFVYGKSGWNRLRVVAIDGLALVQAQIEIGRNI